MANSILQRMVSHIICTKIAVVAPLGGGCPLLIFPNTLYEVMGVSSSSRHLGHVIIQTGGTWVSVDCRDDTVIKLTQMRVKATDVTCKRVVFPDEDKNRIRDLGIGETANFMRDDRIWVTSEVGDKYEFASTPESPERFLIAKKDVELC